MNRRVLFIFLIGFIMCGAVSAERAPETPFQHALESYQAGDYNDAARILEAMASNGLSGANVYYNLGNSYYKLGQLGKAIWAYERAFRLNPRDEDIRWNLNLALKGVDDLQEADTMFPWTAWLKEQLSYLTSEEISLGFAGTVALFAMAILGYAIVVPLRPVALRVMFLAMLLCLMTGGMMFVRWSDVRYTTGVVQERETYVRYGPAEGNSKAFLLHEGSKVSIEKETEGWYFVRFGKRQSGWLPKHTVLKID